MQNLIKNIALVAIAALCALSCSKQLDADDQSQDGNKILINAKVAHTPQTKIGFTDYDSAGVQLEWEQGDIFTVYDSEESSVGKFVCEDAQEGRFSAADGVELTEGETYTAKYGSEIVQYSQNGDDIDNLDDHFYMESDKFTYTSNKTANITFKHQRAILTIKFTSDIRPKKLMFSDGNGHTYTANFTTIEPEDGIYTTHITVEPIGETVRTLTFVLYDSENKEYDRREVTTSKAYIAGYRYTATLTDLEQLLLAGSGSESDPYQIWTVNHLNTIAQNNKNNSQFYSEKYLVLKNDIDLGGIDSQGNGIEENQFSPIGNAPGYPFRGNFDGQGYEISGLYINAESQYVALFGVTSDGSIKNLSVSGKVVTSNSYAAGIVGSNSGTTITNCYNKVDVRGKESVGGVVGRITQSAKITNCYNLGSIEASSSIGGIAGYSTSGSTFSNCYNAGVIIGTSSSYSIGSIVGNGTSCTYTNCYYNKDIYDGAGYGVYTATSCTTSEMKNRLSFVTQLTNNAYEYNKDSSGADLCAWEGVVDGYPTLSFGVVPVYEEDSSFWEGSGTEYDPFIIATVNEMTKLSDKVNAGTSFDGFHFKLDNSDIYITTSGGFNPIGTYDNRFEGSFDGDNHTINLGIKNDEADFVGLFGVISGATIENLTLAGSITGKSIVGGVAAQAYSSTIYNCKNEALIVSEGDYFAGIVARLYENSTIVNCVNNGGISTSVQAFYAGGIAAFAKASTINNCRNDASISASEWVGGIVGYVTKSTVSDSHNIGGGSKPTKGSQLVGGVVGEAISSSITGCTNNTLVYEGSSEDSNILTGGIVGAISLGSTISNSTNSGNISGKSYIGGITGAIKTGSSVSKCVNSGSVESTTSNNGGIAGWVDDSTIEYCTNKGDIASAQFVGGIAGLTTNSTIQNSANITQPNIGSVSGSLSVGGIVGMASGTKILGSYNLAEIFAEQMHLGGVVGNTSNSNIVACYNRGAIKINSTDKNCGGIIGYANDSSTLENSYSSSSVKGSTDNDLGALMGNFYSSSCSYSYGDSDLCKVLYINKTYSSINNSELKTGAQMTDSGFITLINNGLTEAMWVTDSNSINYGYPILKWQADAQ